jgi:hypothetical protein
MGRRLAALAAAVRPCRFVGFCRSLRGPPSWFGRVVFGGLGGLCRATRFLGGWGFWPCRLRRRGLKPLFPEEMCGFWRWHPWPPWTSWPWPLRGPLGLVVVCLLGVVGGGCLVWCLCRFSCLFFWGGAFCRHGGAFVYGPCISLTHDDLWSSVRKDKVMPPANLLHSGTGGRRRPQKLWRLQPRRRVHFISGPYLAPPVGNSRGRDDYLRCGRRSASDPPSIFPP